jgi:hypothetical protein
MGAAIIEEDGDLKVLKITGLLKKKELDAVQERAVSNDPPKSDVKLLVIAEGFQGWERGADWGDMTFFTTYGDRIGRIAIVADPRWERDLLMFAIAGLRKAPVRFFPESQLAEARAWLALPV